MRRDAPRGKQKKKNHDCVKITQHVFRIGKAGDRLDIKKRPLDGEQIRPGETQDKKNRNKQIAPYEVS